MITCAHRQLIGPGGLQEQQLIEALIGAGQQHLFDGWPDAGMGLLVCLYL